MRPAFQLCYITDRHALEPKPLLDTVRAAIAAGIDLVQIREKDLATRERVELVRAAVESARGTATRLVVNDRLDVALTLGAAGIHLGTQSLPARVVRECIAKRLAPDVASEIIVGVSCHSLDEALDAA